MNPREEMGHSCSALEAPTVRRGGRQQGRLFSSSPRRARPIVLTALLLLAILLASALGQEGGNGVAYPEATGGHRENDDLPGLDSDDELEGDGLPGSGEEEYFEEDGEDGEVEEDEGEEDGANEEEDGEDAVDPEEEAASGDPDDGGPEGDRGTDCDCEDAVRDAVAALEGEFEQVRRERDATLAELAALRASQHEIVAAERGALAQARDEHQKEVNRLAESLRHAEDLVRELHASAAAAGARADLGPSAVSLVRQIGKIVKKAVADVQAFVDAKLKQLTKQE